MRWAYITAAYFFTSSTSFANPAVTVARMFSNSFAGIAPPRSAVHPRPSSSALRLGLLVRALYPRQPSVAGMADGSRLVTRPAMVLFVCVHNAGRSQMAAGLPHPPRRGPDRRPLGRSEPGRADQPVAVQAMAEVGIDITGGRPKTLTADAVCGRRRRGHHGLRRRLPGVPGKRYEDWELDDPAGQSIEEVRPVRDEIRARVQALVDDLVPELNG